jgi:acetyl esterase/lipase
MIHGGSHIIFSRKDVRPAQTRLLLDKGYLPVSLDHRMCPEVKLVEGPMADVLDALQWARTDLPRLMSERFGLEVDGERIAVVGWSSGSQLAMSLGWTAPSKGIKPPDVILAFYGPSDYEDPCKYSSGLSQALCMLTVILVWKHPIQPVGAEDKGLEYDVLEVIQDEPITGYGIVGAWEPLSDPRIETDPRTRIVLHNNWKAQTLPIIIRGLPSKKAAAKMKPRDWNNLEQPTAEELVPCSPRAQIVRGNFRTPTFFIHGTNDELVPWQQTQGTFEALRERGVTTELVLVKGAPHVCDLSSDPESDGWKATLRAYEFMDSYIF